jgi:hypothetical protein
MNSVEITRYLYKKGYITKEAALRILKTRNDLVKEATQDLASEIFGFKKEAVGKWPWSAKLPPVGAAPPAAPVGPSYGRAVRNILPLLGLAGLVAIGTTGAKVGLGALSDIKLKKEVQESYSKMFAEYPELREAKPRATKFFNMMARFAPVLASNPIVAGTWVKGTMDRNLVDPHSIQQLIEAQKEWEHTRSLKSPLIGVTRELPESASIFEKAMKLGVID